MQKNENIIIKEAGKGSGIVMLEKKKIYKKNNKKKQETNINHKIVQNTQ